MEESKNVYEEVIIDGKKEKVVIEYRDGSIESVTDTNFLEDTIELEKIEVYNEQD